MVSVLGSLFVICILYCLRFWLKVRLGPIVILLILLLLCPTSDLFAVGVAQGFDEVIALC